MNLKKRHSEMLSDCVGVRAEWTRIPSNRSSAADRGSPLHNLQLARATTHRRAPSKNPPMIMAAMNKNNTYTVVVLREALDNTYYAELFGVFATSTINLCLNTNATLLTNRHRLLCWIFGRPQSRKLSCPINMPPTFSAEIAEKTDLRFVPRCKHCICIFMQLCIQPCCI